MGIDTVLRPSVGSHQSSWALMVLCLGSLMVAIDATVINVALRVIKQELHFSEVSLVWVVNAYLIASGGFLLLAGRLGDLWGHRRMFSIGVLLFTIASLGCGLATSPVALIAARVLQGLSGAVVSTVSVALIMSMFDEAPQRVRAFGLCAFVSTGGGSLGLLLGGALTSLLNWHWIFLVNVPIGIAVYILCFTLVPRDSTASIRGPLDVAGALTSTGAVMLVVYSLVNSGQTGWGSMQTAGGLVIAGMLFALFIAIEAKAPTPLIPLELLRIRRLAVSNIVALLLTSALLAWSFLFALYMQIVLQCSPLEVSLAFLPTNLVGGLMSLYVTPKLIGKFGTGSPLVIGLIILGIGLLVCTRAPVDGSLVSSVLPEMLLIGLGSGMACDPVLLTGVSSVSPIHTGAASGLVNTSFTIGGALGLTILASLAAVRTGHLRHMGYGVADALTGGYHTAFWISGVLVVLGAVISAVCLHGKPDVASG